MGDVSQVWKPDRLVQIVAGTPCVCRKLDSAILVMKSAEDSPHVTKIRIYASTAATMPNTRPQCTSRPGMVPIMLAAPPSRVDGLLRLAGSRIGPSTRSVCKDDWS